MALAPLVASCAPYETQTAQANLRPDPSRGATTQHEKKPGEFIGDASVSGNTVEVTVARTEMCREVTTTPMIADTTAEKKLTSVGRGTQYLLGGGALVLVGAGAYYLGSPCKKPDTDAAGNSIQRDCTGQEAKDRKNGGVGLLAVGGAAAAMFVVNIVRAQDDVAVAPAKDDVAEGAWKRCQVAPAEDIQVTLMLPGGTETATTDEDGVAKFDLGQHDAPPGIDNDSTVRVMVDGKKVAQADLSGLDVFPKWRNQVQEQRAAEKVRMEEQEKEDEAKAAAERARIVQLDRACKDGDGSACNDLGTIFYGSSRGARYLKRACELNFQEGCANYQGYVEEVRQAREEAARRRAQATAIPKRSLQNPDDVRALQQYSRVYTQCLMKCARAVQSCIHDAPEGYGRGQSKAQYVQAHCSPPYEQCQVDCEIDLNRQGFCAEKSIINGRNTGAVGPCP